MVKTLTDSTYKFVLERDVLKLPKIAVVKVAATWCGPCKLLKPHFERWEEDLSNETDVAFYEIDNDNNPNFIAQYNVSKLPTILFFVYGVLVYELHGMTRRQVFDDLLDKSRKVRTEIEGSEEDYE